MCVGAICQEERSESDPTNGAEVQEQNKKEEEKKREAVRQKEEIAAAKEVGR